MNFTIEHEREDDGRWLAEVPELPGVLAYGATQKEAMAKAEALALLYQSWRKADEELPVMMVTAFASVESAIAAMKRGAFDYIAKPCPLDELQVRVQRALERNTVVLPAGYEVSAVSQSATIGRTRDGKTFVALVNLNGENSYTVTIRARK